MDGRTKERNATISPYFDGRIKMNGPYPEITNISFLAKLFFKTFISLKHLSDYRTVRLSDCRTIGLSDYSYGPVFLPTAKAFILFIENQFISILLSSSKVLINLLMSVSA